jgi:putative peptide zinc metalloprotease protein
VVSIILLVATKFFFVGIALALWGAFIMIVRPIWMTGLFLARSPQLAAHRQRAIATAAGLLAAILAVVFLVPVPQWTRSEGVVWAPESAQVRAGTACWIRRVLPGEGGRVAKGERLFECEDPELPARVRLLEQQLEELHARDRAYFVDSRLNLDVVREEIVHTEARLADARRRLNGLVALSPVDGRFVFPGQADAPGRFVQRGELVAYVLEPGPATVRVVVDQADVDLVRAATRAVAIKPADRVAQTLPARMTREVPGASERLPSLALGVPGGGPFAVDPRSLTDPREETSPRAMVPVFQFDLEVAPESRLDAIGLRVFVRFDHPPESLARQWYRAARRVMLKVFEV